MSAPGLGRLPIRAPTEYHKTTTLRELKKLPQELTGLQNRPCAGNRHSMLGTLQGLDANGKNSLIRRVLSCRLLVVSCRLSVVGERTFF